MDAAHDCKEGSIENDLPAKGVTQANIVAAAVLEKSDQLFEAVDKIVASVYSRSAERRAS